MKNYSVPGAIGRDMQLLGLRVPDYARSGSNEFVVNLLMFGKASHLSARQASLRDWRGQRQFSLQEHTLIFPLDKAQIRTWMTDTNLWAFSFSVCDRSSVQNNVNDSRVTSVSQERTTQSPSSFTSFVEFLSLTESFVVRGRQLRVALVLDPPTEATEGSGCNVPGDSPLTAWNDTALFDGTHYWNKTGYVAWAELAGRLAVQFPHLVSLDIDDMSHDINPPFFTFTPDVVANITSRMRRHAPWLTLAPTIYYKQTVPSFVRWPDLPLALDAPIFYCPGPPGASNRPSRFPQPTVFISRFYTRAQCAQQHEPVVPGPGSPQLAGGGRAVRPSPLLAVVGAEGAAALAERLEGQPGPECHGRLPDLRLPGVDVLRGDGLQRAGRGGDHGERAARRPRHGGWFLPGLVLSQWSLGYQRSINDDY
jgi:hypothetical protein